ncbi:MAG: collagen-like triple helix repeat-containing protein [Solirubrobacteraceae bacterium]
MSDNERERVRLVEADYANTSDFIKNVVTTGSTIRGLAVTIWLALLGFSVQQGLWELAALAGIVAAVFWLLDGYHGWLCAEALTHARAAEKVTSLYFNALSRGEDNKRALTDFRSELRFHRFGLYLNIRAFRPRDLLSARPRVFYVVLYPVLILLALIALALVAAGAIGATSSQGEASGAAVVVGAKGAHGPGSPHGSTKVDVLVGPNTSVSLIPSVDVKGLTLDFGGKPSPLGIRGERGERGPLGPRGIQGAHGRVGPPGRRGATGPPGPRGLPAAGGQLPGS